MIVASTIVPPCMIRPTALSRSVTSSGVRNLLFCKINVHKGAHGITVIDSVFDGFIGKIEPVLHKVHAQHGLNASCRTAALSTGVIRLDNVDPLIPRNDGIHHVQKLFTLCFALTVGIFNVTESHLGHNHTILSREHIILHLII